ncbi:hypothetical protein Pmar_PMAR012423 [Perkinsus marinus ATCC 50983]|uniref:Uncharacterized protein n=1 Tax=Perkinsus marinus (strain ATCC 50983 / TXsc) TaxID=423536 RepID=C5K7A8_PERM5|nr:hypothetical protein Pmar_PMAR012423 [Perkinsus marinus ATCC 50983]EER19443.1 hypothetical protein Pmar_PMAR012423 [Perkinsus marinus ATCC 50983]|eukprot:XP_002787647.1 hypothetical protein Pmar_PMAR012423 [Perkinsus marinus ATCC 50983]
MELFHVHSLFFDIPDCLSFGKVRLALSSLPSVHPLYCVLHLCVVARESSRWSGDATDVRRSLPSLGQQRPGYQMEICHPPNHQAGHVRCYAQCLHILSIP